MPRIWRDFCTKAPTPQSGPQMGHPIFTGYTLHKACVNYADLLK
jgi:hypothetical protein